MAFGGCTNHKQMQAYLLHEKKQKLFAHFWSFESCISFKKHFGYHVSSDIFLWGLVKYNPSPICTSGTKRYFSKDSYMIQISWSTFLIIFSSGAWLSIPPSPHLHIRHLRIPDYKLPPWAHQWPTNLPTLPRGTHVKILQNPGKRFNTIKQMKVFSH